MMTMAILAWSRQFTVFSPKINTAIEWEIFDLIAINIGRHRPDATIRLTIVFKTGTSFHHLSPAAVFGHIENQGRSLLVSRTSYQGIHHPDVALFDLHGFRCPNQMPRLTPIQINRHV